MSVYNGAKFLAEAIDSILAQTFTDFEFIIINDASSDDSLHIINSYQDARIVLIQNTKNIGLTKSLNIGIAKAKGKYKGRPPKIDNAEIKRVLGEGNSISKTAEILGVSMSSVQRAKKI